MGCASYLYLRCSSCEWTNEFYTSKLTNNFYEVNRRMVYAMRSIGCGRAGAKRFCGLMNMPPPPRPTPYALHNKALLQSAKTVYAKTVVDASKEIHDLKQTASNEVVDCAVSCDGTWQRRGFSSLNGCVATISMDTGKILDVEPLSKVCHTCKKLNKKPQTSETASLKAEHEPKCKANYEGSAPAMEPEGALRIFNRSVESNKLRYSEFYGDGDSKSYAAVKDVYEEDNVTVTKKECVGHVQKRVGTALRKLKKENKGLGRKGRLTDAMIEKLQNYYGIAIRTNCKDIESMKKAIYAALCHCASSGKDDYHIHCPDGKDSWCGFKRDKANATKEYKHGAGLPKQVIGHVKPIFDRLSESSLLQRCLDGKTQNQNESFNAMIWNRVPKEVFVGSDVFSLGVYDAAAHFNTGASAAIELLKDMGLASGKFCSEECLNSDKLRVRKGNYKCQDKNKKRRKVLRGEKKKKGDKLVAKEGETYASGAF
ncbi:uncharacterized protein LOC114544031 [Dendronephthya gigantea]|uniref:uncharacterized protein LOC114544031 n=1 Tax=Dendronephthya gigantea TaxID=151771 RepID=UPI001069B0CE|nr:uncharacterized protein LOC114544031 [Dendronephthya gigantea]